MNILVLTPNFPKDQDDYTLHFIYLEIKYLLEFFPYARVFVFTTVETRISLKNLTVITYRPPTNKRIYISTALKFLTRLNRDSFSYWFAGLTKPKRFTKLLHQQMQIREIIKKYHIDIIHSHFAFPQGCAGSPANVKNIPQVITLRGADIKKSEELQYGLRRDPFFEKMLKLSLKKCSAITVASVEFKRITVEFLNEKNSNRIRIIPNGTVLENSPHTPQEFDGVPGPAGDKKIVLFAGGFHKRKGFSYLIEAARLVVKECGDVEFWVIGNGDIARKEDYLKQIADLDLADRFRFIGIVPPHEMNSYYECCSMLVHPAIIEGFGNVVIEAMAQKRPVIGFNTGGLTDIIDESINGFKVEKYDAAGLAKKIIYLLQNPRIAQELGLNGYKKVAAEYSIEKRVKSFYELYSELLGN